jgi:hypothetical protein
MTFMTNVMWLRMAWATQMLCIRLISIGNTVNTYNNILIASFKVKFAMSLFPALKAVSLGFLRRHKNLIFAHPEARTYKLCKFLVARLNEDAVDTLTHIWTMENEVFRATPRCTALFMRSLDHLTHVKDQPVALVGKVFEVLAGSPLESLARSFAEIWSAIVWISRTDENCNEFLADHIIELANFFHPSPDSRVKDLLDFGVLHSQHVYTSKCTIAQLTDPALITEVLACQQRFFEGVFSDHVHPAQAFVFSLTVQKFALFVSL